MKWAVSIVELQNSFSFARKPTTANKHIHSMHPAQCSAKEFRKPQQLELIAIQPVRAEIDLQPEPVLCRWRHFY